MFKNDLINKIKKMSYDAVEKCILGIPIQNDIVSIEIKVLKNKDETIFLYIMNREVELFIKNQDIDKSIEFISNLGVFYNE